MRKLNFKSHLMAEMNEREAMLAGLESDHQNSTGFAAFGDWLDEHGEPDLAIIYRRYGLGDPVVLPTGCARGNPVHHLTFDLTPQVNMDAMSRRRGNSCYLHGYRFGNERPFPVMAEFLARAMPYNDDAADDAPAMLKFLMTVSMEYNRGRPHPLGRFCQDYMDNYPWFAMRNNPNLADNPEMFRQTVLQVRNELNQFLRAVAVTEVHIDATRLHPDNYPPF